MTVQKIAPTPKSDCLPEHLTKTYFSAKRGAVFGDHAFGKSIKRTPKTVQIPDPLFSSHSIGEHLFLASGMQDNVWIVGVRPCSGIQLLERVPKLELYPI
jgi:hypothetical protein